MYSKAKRTLSLFLALLMLVGSAPTLAFAIDFDTLHPSEPSDTPSYDYSPIYTKDGLVFSWSGYDLKEGDKAIAVLENAAGDTDIPLKNESTVHDGYFYTQDTVDFSAFLPYEMVGTANDIMLIKDFTLEIHLRQVDPVGAPNSTKGGAFKAPTLADGGIAVRAFNLNEESGDPNWQNNHPIDESYGFISDTYAILAPLSGTGNVQLATDVGWKPTKWLGNTQNEPYAFALRYDYETTKEDQTLGTVLVDYVRDFTTVNSALGNYNARYYGNWVSSSSPSRATPSNQKLSFGGLGFGYSMIRIYSCALTDFQMAQNHVADLLSYYQIDPLLYTELSEKNKREACEMLRKLYIGATDKETIEEILALAGVPTNDEKYTPLYVQSGLVYIWDGFSLALDGEKISSLPSILGDGLAINRMTEHREYSGIGASGGGTAMNTVYHYDKSVLMVGNNRQLYLTNLLPMREAEDGTKLPSDMTLEATLAYPSAYKTAPSQTESLQNYMGYDGGVLYFGPLGSKGQGITYHKFNGNYDLNGPLSGKGTMSSDVQGPLRAWLSPFETLDSGATAFLGNSPDTSFHVAYTFDYDEQAIDYDSILYNFKAFRDGEQAFSTSNSYSNSADYSSSDGSATRLQLTFGIDVTTQFYAFRLYDRALTELEIKQNHTIDLFKYYEIDPALYLSFDIATRERLYEALSPYQLGETTKEELDAILSNFALTGGVLGVVDISDYMSFLGIQARTDDYAAIRLRYAISRDSLKNLDEIGATYSFGALYARKADVSSKEDMKVVFNYGINEFTKAEGEYTFVSAYHKGELSSKLSYLSDDGKTIDFGVMLPALEKAELASGKANEEYYARGYIGVYLNGAYFVLYLDTDEGVFGESISIAEASEYFVCNGYAYAEIPSLLADEVILAGAQASNDLYLDAWADYKTMNSDIDVLNGAYAGASVSSSKFLEIDSIMSKINMGAENIPVTYSQAVEYAKISATARGELNVYLSLGVKAYEQAKDLANNIGEKLTARYDATYAALLALGLEEAAAEEKALEITSSFASYVNTTLDEVSTLDEAYNLLTSLETKISESQAELKLSKIISAPSSLFIEKTSVARYTILTTSEYLAVAEALQQFFIARQGAFVGIYQIDNPYVSGMHDFSGTKAIYIGLTDKNLADDTYSVYYDKALSSLCIEGENETALLAGGAAFLHQFAIGTGRITVSASDIGETLINQDYVEMYTMNTQTEYKKINISENSAVGVMEGFTQRLSEMPDHVTVLPKLNSADFAVSDSLTVYVAKDGNDANDGSFEHPFATLDRALEAVSYCGGATIQIRGGTYQLNRSVKIGQQHSGARTSPLFITNYEDEEVIFTTGLPFSGSQLVRADQADFLPENALNRLNTFKKDNAANVYAIDLTTLGLTEEALASYASGEKSPGLYVGNQSYRVSRWPNYGAEDSDMLIKGGFVKVMNSQADVKEVGRVTGGISNLYEEHKNNPNNFFEIYFDETTYASHLLSYDEKAVTDGQLWMLGSVYEEWDNRISNLTLHKDGAGKNFLRSDRISPYGVKYTTSNHVYFYNMIEDLDTDLEYQVDIDNMVLYVYASESPADKELTLCYNSFAAFDLDGVENVVLDGLKVERCFGLGASIKNTDHALVQDFVFRNLSGYAVQMAACVESGVTYSEFYVCNGINILAGNNQALLQPERNFVQNNRFTNAGDNHDMTFGVYFAGVGTVISHNYFLETRVFVSRTYECIIEYNEFERGSQYTHDDGPIYVNDNTRALHVRYNYMHDLNKSGYGIYLDDLSSGDYVYGNVVHYADGAAGGQCVNLHNGSMNVIMNNICINANGPGISNNINYYPQTINGENTKGGGLAYRWADIIKNRLSKNGNYIAEEIRYSRYPMYAAYTEVVDRAIVQMNRTENWDHSNKLSPLEDDEIYVRTPLYNVYMNNVSYGCKSGVLSIPVVGRDTAINESNVHFDKGTANVFTDYENGDFTLAENSLIFERIPDFKAPDMSQMGVLAD